MGELSCRFFNRVIVIKPFDLELACSICIRCTVGSVPFNIDNLVSVSSGPSLMVLAPTSPL